MKEQPKIHKTIGLPLNLWKYIEDSRGNDTFSAYVVKLIESAKEKNETQR